MLSALLFAAALPAVGQVTERKTQVEPVETSVCSVLKDPGSFNNKLVKIRGYVIANFEYSALVDESCAKGGIWFLFADGSGPPQLEAWVSGTARAGAKDTKGQRAEPLPVELVADANYEQLVHYWELSESGRSCAARPHVPGDLPDCTTYRVTATFVGRLEGIATTISAKHQKKTEKDLVKAKGFGQMGMFDAQIVVQSVENVVAVDETDLRKNQPKPK